MAQEDLFKKLVAHCKEYGYVFQSSEIYDGLGAVYDYGQYGVELKNNIKKYWWDSMVLLNDNVVGCVGAWPHSKINGALELIRMSVDASIRRKGIATLLIKQVEKYALAEGFSKVILDTGAMMKAACSFYERCGYKKKKTYSDKLGGIEVHVQPFVKDLR